MQQMSLNTISMHALTLTRTGGERSTTDKIPIIGNPGIGNNGRENDCVVDRLRCIVCLFASNMKSIEPIFVLALPRLIMHRARVP